MPDAMMEYSVQRLICIAQATVEFSQWQLPLKVVGKTSEGNHLKVYSDFSTLCQHINQRLYVFM